jgi:hypothetical protein
VWVDIWFLILKEEYIEVGAEESLNPQQVTGGGRTFHYDKLHNFDSSDEIKKEVGICSTNGGNKKCIQNVILQPK